ncbi:MAG: hypothetical protein JWM59_3412 [Verrucomicrobiales bacterium]|nr:hypothetical protein [Verrucomicrobiales bacterium]
MIPLTLIEAHLAGTLTDGDQRLLEETLCLDPSSARTLVHAARLETALEGHFAPAGTRVPTAAWLSAITATPAGSDSVAQSVPIFIPIPQPPVGHRRHPWTRRTLAAAALLTGAALVVHFQLRHPSGSGMDQASRPVHRPLFQEAAVARPGNPVPASVSVRTPEQEAEALAFRQLTVHYGLTDLQLDQPQSIPAAVDHLLSRAKALNHLNRAEIAAMTFRMPEDPAVAEKITSTTLSLPFQTMALMEAVEWYAASVQCRVACPEAGVLTFVPWTGEDGQPPDDRELVSREYILSEKDLRQAPGLADEPDPGNVIEARLRAWGVPMGNGASVVYDSGAAGLRATLTTAAHWTLDQKLPNVRGKTGPTVFLSTKFINLFIDYPLENQLLDDPGFQMLMRELSQRKGVDLMTAPSAITRSGVEAKVEIFAPAENGNGPGAGTETAPVKDPGSSGEGGSAPGADGAQPAIRILILPWVEGEVTKLSGSVDIVAGPENNAIEVDFAGMVPHRHTAFFSLSGTSDDSRVFAAITVTEIDAAGQALPERANGKTKAESP